MVHSKSTLHDRCYLIPILFYRQEHWCSPFSRSNLLHGQIIIYRPRQKMCFYTFAFADVSYNMCTMLRRFIHGRLFFFFAVAPGASPHIFVSKMRMTSTQGLHKDKAKNAEPDPGTVVLSKLSMAASEARNATMASIAELVDDAAAKNGGRVPKDFIPKVIQQFSIAAPGLNRDKINYYRKVYEKKCKRGATNGSAVP